MCKSIRATFSSHSTQRARPLKRPGPSCGHLCGLMKATCIFVPDQHHLFRVGRQQPVDKTDGTVMLLMKLLESLKIDTIFTLVKGIVSQALKNGFILGNIGALSIRKMRA